MAGNVRTYNGPAIQALRRKSFLNRKSFAEACGIGVPHLTNIENGNRQPSDALAETIASRLGLNDLRPIIGEVGKEQIPVVAEPVT